MSRNERGGRSYLLVCSLFDNLFQRLDVVLGIHSWLDYPCIHQVDLLQQVGF